MSDLQIQRRRINEADWRDYGPGMGFWDGARASIEIDRDFGRFSGGKEVSGRAVMI